MKKFFNIKFATILAMIAIGLSFTSCSDDDDNNGGGSDDIVGTWKSVYPEQHPNYLYFKSNGDLFFVIIEDGDMYTDEGSWVRNGSVLTFFGYDSETTTWKIESLSSNSLTVLIQVVYIGNNDYVYTTEKMTFTRCPLSEVTPYLSDGWEDGDDDDDNGPASTTGTLTGKWIIDKIITEYYTTISGADAYNQTFVDKGNGAYWEFTSTKLTVNDPTDVMNGQSVSYTFNQSDMEISISGTNIVYEVQKLTSNELILFADNFKNGFGIKTTIYFYR